MRTACPSCPPAGISTVAVRLFGRAPVAPTPGAGVPDDGPAAAAVGTGHDHAEHAAEPLLRHAALPAALDANAGAGAGLCARALARFACVLALELDVLLTAGGYLLKRQLDLSLEVE